MTFTDWQQLIANAGGNISFVDQAWLLAQFQAGISPAIVAGQIRAGQAPSPPQYAAARHRSVFSSGVYFCAHLLLWHGWLIILSVMVIATYLVIGVVLASVAAADKPTTGFPVMALGVGFLIYMVPVFLGAAAMGALFVVAGSYVKKNIHQFEN